MGTPTPDPWPDLDDNLFYRVQVSAYGGAPPWNNCGGDLLAHPQGCTTGAQIKNWIRVQWECSGRELVPFSGFTEQRIDDIFGPYPDYDTCFLDIPP